MFEEIGIDLFMNHVLKKGGNIKMINHFSSCYTLNRR